MIFSQFQPITDFRQSWIEEESDHVGGALDNVNVNVYILRMKIF
jgi:hypothetical protein